MGHKTLRTVAEIAKVRSHIVQQMSVLSFARVPRVGGSVSRHHVVVCSHVQPPHWGKTEPLVIIVTVSLPLSLEHRPSEGREDRRNSRLRGQKGGRRGRRWLGHQRPLRRRLGNARLLEARSEALGIV